MGTLYCQTTGHAQNSGSTDTDSASLTGSNATVSGSTVTLDGSPDLSGLVTSGASQSSIYLHQATNSNRKIFWITSFDNSAKTVTVDVAPTGVTGSAWRIGGRVVLTPASQEGALRAGDDLVINDSPASQSATLWTFRNSGDSTSGPAKIRGLTQAVTLTATSTNPAVTVTSGVANTIIENLTLVQQGATGSAVLLANGAGNTVRNVKVTDAGSNGCIRVQGQSDMIVGCDLSGSAGPGVVVEVTAANTMIHGNYIHDNTTHGIINSQQTMVMTISFNVIDTNGGEGIAFTGAATSYVGLAGVLFNTVYGSQGAGLQVTDAETRLFVLGNIFSNNGLDGSSPNIEWTAGSAEICSVHFYNDFHQGSATSNLSGLTANSTEITSDPQFVGAAGGNFTLDSGSPCLEAGFPGAFPGGLSTGYLSMGAVQPDPAGGGGTVVGNVFKSLVFGG